MITAPQYRWIICLLSPEILLDCVNLPSTDKQPVSLIKEFAGECLSYTARCELQQADISQTQMKASVSHGTFPTAVIQVQYMFCYLPSHSIFLVPLQVSIADGTHLVLFLLLNAYLEKLSLKILSLPQKAKKVLCPRWLIGCKLNAKPAYVLSNPGSNPF